MTSGHSEIHGENKTNILQYEYVPSNENVYFNFQEFNLLVKNGKNFANELANKHMILVVGESGSGKSTLIHYICGSKFVTNSSGQYSVCEVKDLVGLSKIIINHSTSSSDNIYITPVFLNHDTILCEAPVFEPTNHSEKDLAKSIAFYDAINNCKTLRIVLVINEKQFGTRGHHIMSICKNMVNLLPVSDYYNDISIAFAGSNIDEVNKIIKTCELENEFLELIKQKTSSSNTVIMIDPLKQDVDGNTLNEIIKRDKIRFPRGTFSPSFDNCSLEKFNRQIMKDKELFYDYLKDFQPEKLDYMLSIFVELHDNLVDFEDFRAHSILEECFVNLKENLNEKYQAFQKELNLTKSSIFHADSMLKHQQELIDAQIFAKYYPNETLNFEEQILDQIGSIKQTLKNNILDIDSTDENFRVLISNYRLLVKTFSNDDHEVKTLLNEISKKYCSKIESLTRTISESTFINDCIIIKKSTNCAIEIISDKLITNKIGQQWKEFEEEIRLNILNNVKNLEIRYNKESMISIAELNLTLLHINEADIFSFPFSPIMEDVTTKLKFHFSKIEAELHRYIQSDFELNSNEIQKCIEQISSFSYLNAKDNSVDFSMFHYDSMILGQYISTIHKKLQNKKISYFNVEEIDLTSISKLYSLFKNFEWIGEYIPSGALYDCVVSLEETIQRQLRKLMDDLKNDEFLIDISNFKYLSMIRKLEFQNYKSLNISIFLNPLKNIQDIFDQKMEKTFQEIKNMEKFDEIDQSIHYLKFSMEQGYQKRMAKRVLDETSNKIEKMVNDMKWGLIKDFNRIQNSEMETPTENQLLKQNIKFFETCEKKYQNIHNMIDFHPFVEEFQEYLRSIHRDLKDSMLQISSMPFELMNFQQYQKEIQISKDFSIFDGLTGGCFLNMYWDERSKYTQLVKSTSTRMIELIRKKQFQTVFQCLNSWNEDPSFEKSVKHIMIELRTISSKLVEYIHDLLYGVSFSDLNSVESLVKEMNFLKEIESFELISKDERKKLNEDLNKISDSLNYKIQSFCHKALRDINQFNFSSIEMNLEITDRLKLLCWNFLNSDCKSSIENLKKEKELSVMRMIDIYAMLQFEEFPLHPPKVILENLKTYDMEKEYEIIYQHISNTTIRAIKDFDHNDKKKMIKIMKFTLPEKLILTLMFHYDLEMNEGETSLQQKNNEYLKKIVEMLSDIRSVIGRDKEMVKNPEKNMIIDVGNEINNNILSNVNQCKENFEKSDIHLKLNGEHKYEIPNQNAVQNEKITNKNEIIDSNVEHKEIKKIHIDPKANGKPKLPHRNKQEPNGNVEFKDTKKFKSVNHIDQNSVTESKRKIPHQLNAQNNGRIVELISKWENPTHKSERSTPLKMNSGSTQENNKNFGVK